MNTHKYNRPPREADIKAQIYYLRTDEGGRYTPVHTGYRPSHDFGLNGMLNDAQHEYINTEIVQLGETVEAYIWFLCPEYQDGRLFKGMQFTVQEGNKIVGRGKVMAVLNAQLKKKRITSDYGVNR